MTSLERLADEAIRHVAAAFRPRTRDQWSISGLSPTAATEIRQRDIPARARALLSREGGDDSVETALARTQEGPGMSGGERKLAEKVIHAFLNGEEVAVEPAITIGIAVACATAAVVVVVVAIRRGATRREIEPSPHVRLLGRIADRGGEASVVAKALQRTIEEPDVWSLRDALPALRDAAARPLLVALQAEGALAEAAAVGRPFTSDSMVDRSPVGTQIDGSWLVREILEQGFVLPDGTSIVRATVRCETTDWRVLSTHDHPVSIYLLERERGFVSDDMGYRYSWRTRQGFLDAHRLRDEFDERTLQDWATSLANAFAEGSTRGSVGFPLRVGAPGQRFLSLQMIQHGTDVLGDGDVVSVVERHGVPQFGLAAERGLALLPAVVQVRERP